MKTDFESITTLVLGAASVSAFAIGYQVFFNPLHIVWDLDAVLISSQHPLTKAREEFPDTDFTDFFDQVDDDFPFTPGTPNTRTYWRPGAKWLVWALRPFTIQYVFTSAQGSYCSNVVDDIDPDRSIFKRIFHRDQFPDRHLQKNGKDILALVESEQLLKRSILFDDQLRYHKARPCNGVLVDPYVDVREGNSWGEVLRMVWIICQCFFAPDVRTVLCRTHPKKYRTYYELPPS
jgi:hypothetical protein